MKYKINDRVRIKSLDWYNENKDEYGNIDCGDYLMIFEKSQFCGKIVTISSISNVTNSYKIEEDNGHDNWTDEMIEGLVEEETKFGTVSTNANCLTRERIDELNKLATKIDKELPSGNQNVWELPDGYQFTDEDGNIINATKIVLEKKIKEYPKTYEECCKVLSLGEDGRLYTKGYKASLIQNFQRLLICRDAYWKIAGEEMGLGKPWEPDWCDYTTKYCVIYSPQYGAICKRQYDGIKHILAFPTEEMRDAFKEYFDPDIEICKELL